MKLIRNSLILALVLGVSAPIFAQNVGIGTASPTRKLHVYTNAATDGILIDNAAGNGDPVMTYSVNGTSRITMGIDDSDADKFKIGTTAITTNTRMTIQTNGYIGIGTTAPTNELNVSSNHAGDYVGYFENASATGAGLAGYATSTYNALGGVTNNATGLGSYGVHLPTTGAGLAMWGVSNSSDAIGVRGSIPTTGSWLGYGGYFAGGLGYVNGLYNLSDARTKKNVQQLDNALAKVQRLRGVSFEYNEEYGKYHGNDQRTYTGFIAQEVEAVVPSSVAEKYLYESGNGENGVTASIADQDRTTIKVVDYVSLVPLLVEAIKEQQQTIDEMQKKINQLENKN
mgnify:CR=1 FL=1